MLLLASSMILAAIGGALIAWLLTGSLGVAILVFIVLKLFGR